MSQKKRSGGDNRGNKKISGIHGGGLKRRNPCHRVLIKTGGHKADREDRFAASIPPSKKPGVNVNVPSKSFVNAETL